LKEKKRNRFISIETTIRDDGQLELWNERGIQGLPFDLYFPPNISVYNFKSEEERQQYLTHFISKFVNRFTSRLMWRCQTNYKKEITGKSYFVVGVCDKDEWDYICHWIVLPENGGVPGISKIKKCNSIPNHGRKIPNKYHSIFFEGEHLPLFGTPIDLLNGRWYWKKWREYDTPFLYRGHIYDVELRWNFFTQIVIALFKVKTEKYYNPSAKWIPV